VASGLTNPRGFTWGADGTLYEVTPVLPMDTWGWTQDYPDPQNWLSMAWTCDGGLLAKPLGYCNPHFDALVMQADRE
jgi:ABC-type oligopeptide transport system substrate-binding subunit